jgi:hypothetical protein
MAVLLLCVVRLFGHYTHPSPSRNVELSILRRSLAPPVYRWLRSAISRAQEHSGTSGKISEHSGGLGKRAAPARWNIPEHFRADDGTFRNIPPPPRRCLSLEGEDPDPDCAPQRAPFPPPNRAPFRHQTRTTARIALEIPPEIFQISLTPFARFSPDSRKGTYII